LFNSGSILLWVAIFVSLFSKEPDSYTAGTGYLSEVKL